MSGIDEMLGAEEEAAAAPVSSPDTGQSVAFAVKLFVLKGLCDKALAVVPSGGDSQDVLKNFVVGVAPGHLEVRSSDLELSVRATSPSVATEDTAEVAIPAKRLHAILKEAPEGEVQIEVTGEKARVSAPGVFWDLWLKDASDFPAFPDLSAVTFHSVVREQFVSALNAVRHAISRDGARPPLMMVNIEGGTATASDGVRFQRAVLECALDMQIPTAAVSHLLRIMNASEAQYVKVGEAGNALVFVVGNTTFVMQKLPVKFPDMEKAILVPAQANTMQLRLDKAALLEAVRRVCINASSETYAIGLRLSPGKVTVVSHDADRNGAEQALAADWLHGERLVVVNHVHLTEMLSAWPSAACTFLLNASSGKKKPLLLLKDEEQGLIGVISSLHAGLLGYE